MRCEGNAYGFTDENVMGERSETFNREMYAQMASRVLTSPEYVDKLVRADRTLAEKLRNRIADVIETLRSVTSKDIELRKQLRRATKAQGLFERALGAGEAAENERVIDYSFAEVNQDILDMVSEVEKGDFKDNDKVELKRLTPKTAAKIKELTGVDVSDFKVVIEARQMAHVLKDHGKNGKTDHSLEKPEDIAKMEYALQEPDYLTLSGKT